MSDMELTQSDRENIAATGIAHVVTAEHVDAIYLAGLRAGIERAGIAPAVPRKVWADEYGIRDSSGYICAIKWPQRYDGQDERYQAEVAKRRADVEQMVATLDAWAKSAAPEPELTGWGLLLKPPIKHTHSCAFVTKDDGTEWRAEDENCTCGYEWRIRCADYITAYNAWFKRANEAEAAILTQQRDAELWKRMTKRGGACVQCVETVARERSLQAAPEGEVDALIVEMSKRAGWTPNQERDWEAAAALTAARDREQQARADERSKQAKIDALMLEYCPDEMTPEQTKEWGRHQVRSPEAEAALDAAMGVANDRRTQQARQGSQPQTPAQAVAGPAGNPQAEAETDTAIAALVRRKLTSGNEIPVERCTILAKEIAEIDDAWAKSAAPEPVAPNDYAWCRWETVEYRHVLFLCAAGSPGAFLVFRSESDVAPRGRGACTENVDRGSPDLDGLEAAANGAVGLAKTVGQSDSLTDEANHLLSCRPLAAGQCSPETIDDWTDRAADCIESFLATRSRQAAPEGEVDATRYREQLWQVYEAIYGHRSANGIDPFDTVTRAVPAVVKHRDELAAALTAARSRIAEQHEGLRQGATKIAALESALAQARAEERERCAKIAETLWDTAGMDNKGHSEGWRQCRHDCAAAIRSTGDAPKGE